MKFAHVAAAVVSLTSAAFAQFPTCANNCIQQAISGFSGNFQQLCGDQGRLSSLNSCLASSTCNTGDRNTINSYISTSCNNAGGSSFNGVTQTYNSNNAPFPTTSINGAGWGNPSALSAYSSYVSAHPSGFSGPDYSSFTSQYGSVPTGAWGPNGGSWSSNGGSWGGFGGGPFGVGNGGWSPADGGPFGNAWGQGPYGSSSAWTTGAWTSWWGNDKCPPSSWPGWTSGTWSTSAPWTTWTACTARTTAASVYTTYVNGQPTVATSFGYQVAQAQQTGTTFGNAAPSGRTITSGTAVLAFIAAVLVA